MQEEAQLPQQLQRGGKEREGGSGIARGERVLSARARVESRAGWRRRRRLPACQPPPADLHPAGRTAIASPACAGARCRAAADEHGPGRRRGRVSAKFDLVAFPMLQQSEAARGAPGICGAAAGQSGDSTLIMIIK